MLRYMLSTEDEIAARPGIGVISVPAPIVDATALAAFGEPLVFWDAPEPEADGRRWSYVGWGEAVRIDAQGHERYESTQRRASRLFANLVERRHPDLGFAPPPRLFGGVAFRAENARSSPWTGFGDMSFAMPRWLYASSGDRAFLRIALAPGELRSRDEIEATIARLQGDLASPRPASRRAARVEHLGFEAWRAMIEDALAEIRKGTLLKVVPSARSHVRVDAPLDVAAALSWLGGAYPECTRFAFQRSCAVFLGASPERLIRKHGLLAHADALAGSIPRREEHDEALRSALLSSEKDRREHHAVVEAIERVLRPFSSELSIALEPRLRSLRNVHHLFTPITATLSRPVHVLDLVRALHPTPAVCGTPTDAAFAWIAAREPDSRGWYAGAVGWFDAAGDGVFSVAIRSGLITAKEATLFAGAGIVEGSDPEREYAEINAKQASMLAALGLSP